MILIIESSSSRTDLLLKASYLLWRVSQKPISTSSEKGGGEGQGQWQWGVSYSSQLLLRMARGEQVGRKFLLGHERMMDWEGRAEATRQGSQAWVREMVTLGQHAAPSQHIFSTRHHQNPHLSSHLGSLLSGKQPEEAAHLMDGETEAQIAPWVCPERVAGAVGS